MRTATGTFKAIPKVFPHILILQGLFIIIYPSASHCPSQRIIPLEQPDCQCKGSDHQPNHSEFNPLEAAGDSCLYPSDVSVELNSDCSPRGQAALTTAILVCSSTTTVLIKIIYKAASIACFERMKMELISVRMSPSSSLQAAGTATGQHLGDLNTPQGLESGNSGLADGVSLLQTGMPLRQHGILSHGNPP